MIGVFPFPLLWLFSHRQMRPAVNAVPHLAVLGINKTTEPILIGAGQVLPKFGISQRQCPSQLIKLGEYPPCLVDVDTAPWQDSVTPAAAVGNVGTGKQGPGIVLREIHQILVSRQQPRPSDHPERLCGVSKVRWR